jgi:hypothetical protein
MNITPGWDRCVTGMFTACEDGALRRGGTTLAPPGRLNLKA